MEQEALQGNHLSSDSVSDGEGNPSSFSSENAHEWRRESLEYQIVEQIHPPKYSKHGSSNIAQEEQKIDEQNEANLNNDDDFNQVRGGDVLQRNPLEE